MGATIRSWIIFSLCVSAVRLFLVGLEKKEKWKRSESCSVCFVQHPLSRFIMFKGTPSRWDWSKEEPSVVVRVDVKEIHPSSHPFGPLRWTRWTLYCTVRLFFPPRHRVSLSAPCIRCQGPMVYASRILCSLRLPSGLIWCESRVLMLKMPPVGVVRSLCPCGCLQSVRFIYECLSSAVAVSIRIVSFVCLRDCFSTFASSCDSSVLPTCG